MDEHGQKIEQTLQKLGQTPQELVGRVSALSATVSTGWRDLHWRDPHDGRAPQNARAGLLEADGEKRRHLHGKIRRLVFRPRRSVFRRIRTDGRPGWEKRAPPARRRNGWRRKAVFSARPPIGNWLLALYANPRFIQPNARRNEVVNFVKAGLRDLSISRTTFRWGVPVPDAPAHVMYVWVDALSNYITALEYPDTKSKSLMSRYWPADLHMIGKDIIRFHAVYWPAFLMAAGLEPPLRVFGHGFIYNRGEKMSKSVGNVISPDDLLAQYGLDPIRYFLLRDVAYGQDGDISHDAVIQRMNSDLANDLGNLAQRSLSMIAKNGGGQVPQPSAFSEADRMLLERARDLLPLMRQELEEQAFHKALDRAWEVIGDANRYVDQQAPWALKKTDPARMATVLYTLAEVLRHIAILLQPFMPGSMAKMLDQLAVPEDRRAFANLTPDDALEPGTPLPAPEGVFPRYVEENKSA